MSLLQVVVLALIQGFTEFLPISSSAHLALAPWLLGWKDQGLAFDIALHLGTLLAVIVYFFRDWVQILVQGFGGDFGYDPELRRNRSLLWLLAAGTLPVGVCGFLLKSYIETALRSPYVIGVMLIGVAVIMEISERAGRRHRGIDHVNMIDAAGIGLAQVLALIPGTSRSGITIAAGLFRNLERPAAARFSFLLSAPAIGGAAVKALMDLESAGGLTAEVRSAMLIGIAVSAVSGCLAIGFLVRYLRQRSLRFFVWYRIIFGIMVLALAGFFRHPAE
ncbi:MAG: undecaprenyl-diphosphate phosphatase [Acidimicrobiia bacterium]|nr:undecaprenyl-diphosphate phosphatase [Acidimicrobiia bacterium]